MMHVHERGSGSWSPGLTVEEREILFSVALDSLAWCARGRRGGFGMDAYALTDALRVPLASFVTLHDPGGDLRGCMGSLEPRDPLYRSVHENAVHAACRDPRFPPVQAVELDGLRVDVSILSPLQSVPGPEAIRLGEHGVILEKGWRRAVFLPEVAPEQGWTLEQTLSELSRKAGLPADAWRSASRFQVFSSVVLSAVT